MPSNIDNNRKGKVTSIFFRPWLGRENDLYRRLRDNPKGADFKEKIELLWREFEPFAPKPFLKEAQINFHQRWWEMYLTVGLLHLSSVSGFKVETSKEDKGPDVKITYADGKCIWIEAVAPKPGDPEKPDSVPKSELYVFSWDEIPGKDNGKLIEFLTHKFGIDWVKTAKIEKIDNGKAIKVSTKKISLLLKLNDKKNEAILKIDDVRTNKFMAKMENGELNIYNEVTDFPEKECLLRLTNALIEKSEKIEKYLSNEVINQGDPCIIALSSCGLNQFGSLLGSLCPAPLKVLAGCGHLVLSKNKPRYFSKRQRIEKIKSKKTVPVCLFEDPTFNSISAVLYSSPDPINAPSNPESTFQLVLNSSAKVPLPNFFFNNIETWYCEKNGNGEDWKKIPRT